MKKFLKVLCLLMSLTIFLLPLAGCEEKGDVLEVTVDGGEGEKTYNVSYDFYRVIFLDLKNRITDVVQDDEGNKALASSQQKNAAIKEVAESTFRSFYALVALCADHGIAITDGDRDMFQKERADIIASYVKHIETEDLKYEGTKEEYAERLYNNYLALAGMTPEYYEYTYYYNLLAKRLKTLLAGDLSDYIAQNYHRYKQVIITYSKGDAAAEEAARLAISEAQQKLAGGADMDEIIEEYGDKHIGAEIYFDGYGKVLGSSSNESVSTILANAIKALDEYECSDVMSGDSGELQGYFAIYQRLPITTEFVCTDAGHGATIYQYPYVGASQVSPQYAHYLFLLETYTQNVAIRPIDVKAYNKINIKNID